jgi:hypothetical protein
MIILNNGAIDYRDNGRYFNPGTGEWADHTSWADWLSWVDNPSEYLYLLFDEPTDLGSVQTVNVLADIACRGLVHYNMYYTTSTGNFNHSPLNYSTLNITPGQTNIPSITARKIWVEIKLELDPAQGFQFFDGINYRVSQDSQKGTTISFTNINSGSLPGTSADRTYTPSVDVGTIKSAKVTPRLATAYDVDMYVYHSATSTKVSPQIISTGTDVHLTFTGVDGKPRDTEFDIELTVNPEWYMDSAGNLLER